MQNQSKEHIIWEKFRTGNEEAFIQLFHLYSDALFWYGCTLTKDRELIKDCIQELLCNLWQRRINCPKVLKVKSFLLVALRRIILRKLQREKQLILDSSLQKEHQHIYFKDLADSPEDTLILQETDDLNKNQLKLAIQSLSPRQKEAIHLRYYQGLDYEEMAKVMGVQKNSIGHFISQAIKSLRRKITSINTTFFFLLIACYPPG